MSRVGVELMRREGSGSVSPTTPKAFANYSPGLLQPWVYVVHPLFNSEGVPPRQTPSVLNCFGFSLSQGWSNPGATTKASSNAESVRSAGAPNSFRVECDAGG